MKFPKRMFLRLEEDGNTKFYIGYPSLSDTVGGQEAEVVGVYELVSEADVRQPVQYRPKGTKTWTEAK